MERLVIACRRLSVRLTADRRRFTVLCLLTGVAVIFWGRLVFIGSPQQAASAQSVADVQVVDPIKATPKAPVRVVLPERPDRDPFSVDAGFFPIAEETTTQWANSPKSPAPRADLTAEAASSLRLGATLPPSAAVIDGATVRVGHTVAGSSESRFTLVEVHRTHAVLDANGRQFVLRME